MFVTIVRCELKLPDTLVAVGKATKLERTMLWSPEGKTTRGFTVLRLRSKDRGLAFWTRFATGQGNGRALFV